MIGLDLGELQNVALEIGMPKYGGKQIADWIYGKRVVSIDQMTNLSKDFRRRLSESYEVGRREPLSSIRSVDGTVKYLFPGVVNCEVEAVMIPDKERATLCVSSQAGCKMGCRFCMTGRMGFHGNLPSSAIINQILSVDESEDLTNVVFMGMGEPLDNIDAVLKSIDILTAPWGLGWSPKRITVSTVGRPKELARLLEETKVHVAFSLHHPYASEREDLMPVERAFPAKNVLNLLRQYDFSKQRRLSIEYIMWKDINDDRRHADALARLLKGTAARVNLIRYHSIPAFNGVPSPNQRMIEFRDRLNQQGITATIRASRGEDILAACGMLSTVNKR